jgi:Ca-activated chloride channel family protein
MKNKSPQFHSKKHRRLPATACFVVFLVLISMTTPALSYEWLDLWLTPDQQGQRLMDQGKYEEAAGKFTTPDRIGVALFMAGDFENAATVLGRSITAEASYNRGNAMVMQGLYEQAIDSYRNALIKRPGWTEAEQNLQIARLRKEALAPPDDDYGGTGGKLGADEIVFDDAGRNKKSPGEEVLEAADQHQSEEAMRAMWLRKVETRPADFLAARFNYQLAVRDMESEENGNEGGGAK